MLFLLWIIHLAPFVASQDQAQCYATLPEPYVMFATSTAYEIVYEKRTDPVIVERKYIFLQSILWIYTVLSAEVTITLNT
jgi:hypothetical protein